MSPDLAATPPAPGEPSSGSAASGDPGAREQDALDAIAAWNARVAETRDITQVADDLLAAFARAEAASRGSLMSVNPRTGRLRVIAARGVSGVAVGQELAPAPRRISDWVMRERQGVILNGQVSSERFEGSAPRDHIASAISIPLLGPHGALGVLNLARTGPAAVFSPEDLARWEGMGPKVAALLETVHRLEWAEAGFRDARGRSRKQAEAEWGGTRSCRVALARIDGQLFAGDTFEHVSSPDGGVTLMLADVFGSGSDALRIGELARGLFLGHASYHRSPAKIVGRIHEDLLRNDPGSQVSLWVASHSSAGQVVTCNAGYPAALCLSSDGVAERRLVAGGPPAGALPGTFEYEEDRLRLLPGDTIVVMSDGLLGVRDHRGSAYGPAQAEELLQESRHRPIEDLVRRLCADAARFGGSGPPIDDVVAFAARFTRDESPRSPMPHGRPYAPA